MCVLRLTDVLYLDTVLALANEYVFMHENSQHCASHTMQKQLCKCLTKPCNSQPVDNQTVPLTPLPFLRSQLSLMPLA